MGRRIKAIDLVQKEEVKPEIDVEINNNNNDDNDSINTEDAITIIEQYKTNKKEAIQPVVIEDVKPLLIEDTKPPIINDKIKCQFCNKMINAKTLKYSHLKTCSSVLQKVNNTVKPIIKEKVSKTSKTIETQSPPEIIPEIKKEDAKVVRMRNIKEKYNKLVANAF